MKLFAPGYYKKFKCIADKCNHSCCVGWEIDIDSATLEKYKSLSTGYGKTIMQTVDKADAPHFKLCGDGRCPHLDESGLCRIIIELGDSYLADICREHPRFYNVTLRGVEVGLGLSCEEACRIVLSSDCYDEFIELGDSDGEVYSGTCDPLSLRERVYKILKRHELSYEKRLELVSREAGVSLSAYDDGKWREIFAELEYLDESHRELFSHFSQAIPENEENSELLERFLAYLVFRHCSPCESEDELRAAFGFSLLLERTLASLGRGKGKEELIDLARMISEELEYSEDNTESLKLEFY